MTDQANLEYSPDEMRRMGDLVLDRVVRHLASLSSQPACGALDADALCQMMREPAPEQGAPLEPLLDRLFDDWIPRSFTTPGPGYLAYIPGGGLYPAALADFISNATNRFTGITIAAPALVQLEAKVLASLNHPNIAQIHGLKESGNTPALVLEYVKGPTLQDRIAQGPIPAGRSAAHRPADRRGGRNRTRVVSGARREVVSV